MEGRRRVKEQLRKLAAYEFSRTEFSYIERDSGLEHSVAVPEDGDEEPDDLMAAAAEPADGAEVAADATALTIDDLLGLPESVTLEFKATFRHNLHTAKRDEALELEVAKSVAGFMNSRRGGTLLIGVLDDGALRGDAKVRGLAEDIALCGNRGIDGFENTLMTILDRAIGKVATAGLDVCFESRGGRDLCRVDAPAADRPAFVDWKGNQLFFVRMGNTTRQFGIADAVDYIRRRFGS